MVFEKPQKSTHTHTHTHTQIVLVCISLLALPCARADDITDEIAQKTAQIEQLKSAIAEIDSELLRCNQSKRNWTTATVIGGIGVVATGTAAAVQGSKLVKKNKTNKENKKSDE